MDLQKLAVKVFVEPPSSVPLTAFIDIFHGWIQASDGECHDAADYSHMQAGPGIILIANDANVSIDEAENRRGLLFSQKSRLEGSNQEKLRKVFRSALANCRKLEEEPLLCGKLRFGMNEVLISINDRGIAANSDEALEEFKADIGAVARELFGDFEVRYERNRDPRQRLNVRLKASDPSNLRQALAQSQRH